MYDIYMIIMLGNNIKITVQQAKDFKKIKGKQKENKKANRSHSEKGVGGNSSTSTSEKSLIAQIC